MFSFYLFCFALLLLFGLVCFHLHCSAKTTCQLRRLLTCFVFCYSANIDKSKIRLHFFFWLSVCLKSPRPPKKKSLVFCFVFPVLTNNEKQLNQNEFGVCGIVVAFPLLHFLMFRFSLPTPKQEHRERGLCFFTPKVKKNTQMEPFFSFLWSKFRNKKTPRLN